MFWWKLPITVIAWALGGAAVVTSLGAVRYGVLPLTFITLIVRSNYRLGEGPATEKFFGKGVFVDAQSEDPLGVILAQLANHFEILPRPGTLYEMTLTEAEELRLLLTVMVRHPAFPQLGKDAAALEALLPSAAALQNCLSRFPESRTFNV